MKKIKAPIASAHTIKTSYSSKLITTKKVSSSVHLPLSPVASNKSKSFSKKHIHNSSNPQIIKRSKQPTDYIILDGNIYQANTNTERTDYNDFLSKVKRQKQIERKSFLVKSQVSQTSLKKSKNAEQKKRIKFPKLTPQQMIQGLSIEQKKEIFFKLQSQIKNNSNLNNIHYGNYIDTYESKEKGLDSSNEFLEPSSRLRANSIQQRADKFNLLQQKLESLKLQLMFKSEGQVEQLEHMCDQKKISEKQKQSKVIMIQKFKEHKMKILDCTKTLFEKILKEQEYQKTHIQQKQNNLEAILQSLHSFPSLDNLEQLQKPIEKVYQQSQPNLSFLKLKDNITKKDLRDCSPDSVNSFSNPLQIVQNINSSQMFLKDYQHDNSGNLQIDENSLEIKAEQNFIVDQQGQANYTKQFNRQAQYEDLVQQSPTILPPFSQEVTESSKQSEGKDMFNTKLFLKLDLRLDQVVFGQDQYPQNEKDEPKIQNVEIVTKSYATQCTQIQQTISNEVLQPANLKQGKILSEQKELSIPLILTRDKMQSLQFERNKQFKQNLQRHIGFQLGCIEIDKDGHFTTLVDINSYVVNFYEFMMRKYLNTLVDNLNAPYGKSVLDKIYCLQTNGHVMEECYNQINNVMSQENFVEYQKQMMLNIRRCTQYETAHNRAVFQAFTKCINQYRPYYQLEGEVYPWLVSEKGITFYEINQQNIEEVFEKSKIKVLEYCSLLCGLHPPSIANTADQRSLLEAKREDALNKMVKNEIIEHYSDWAIMSVNYECLVRVILAQQIYHQQMTIAVREFQEIALKHQKS